MARRLSSVRPSVRPSVNFRANHFFSQANGRISTKLAHDGLQVSVHPGCAQGQGQRSRDTRTFLDSWNELLRHWRSGFALLHTFSRTVLITCIPVCALSSSVFPPPSSDIDPTLAVAVCLIMSHPDVYVKTFVYNCVVWTTTETDITAIEWHQARREGGRGKVFPGSATFVLSYSSVV